MCKCESIILDGFDIWSDVIDDDDLLEEVMEDVDILDVDVRKDEDTTFICACNEQKRMTDDKAVLCTNWTKGII